MDHGVYNNPLVSRYATREMSAVFSEAHRIGLFRRLWLALAKGEKELGLHITDEQIAEMAANLDNIDFDLAAEREKLVRHDVMAHVYTFGVACPKAAPIIHLGATSCYVTDNADIIIYKEGLELVRDKLVATMARLKEFAKKYRKTPTLGFTHLQAAQLVTVGKRAALWLEDFLLDYENLNHVISSLVMRGVKGTTGTQASFLSLFDGDHSKVKALDEYVVKSFGFKASIPVSGQTYTRKIDYFILSALSGIAQSAYKFAQDVRLLQSRKEIEEPFNEKQIGSSAMAYKRNPMRSERICALSRYLESLPVNAAHTASVQGFERTLDDSANRRIVMGEAFLAADSILELMMNVTNGLVVYEKVIERHLAEEIPFMATETILMECVKAGGNRQELHEKIRVHSMAAEKNSRMTGKSNDLIKRLQQDPAFAAVKDFKKLLNPKLFIGRAPEQVSEFLSKHIDPVLKKHSDAVAKYVTGGDIKC